MKTRTGAPTQKRLLNLLIFSKLDIKELVKIFWLPFNIECSILFMNKKEKWNYKTLTAYRDTTVTEEVWHPVI